MPLSFKITLSPSATEVDVAEVPPSKSESSDAVTSLAAVAPVPSETNALLAVTEDAPLASAKTNLLV